MGRLCNEYSLPRVRFGEGEIHVLRDMDGRVLSDIRTRADNEAAANGISAAIRRLTRRDDIELHVSIAGGRKTMGFFAGYALTLFGRRQDRLSHVLVEPNWENHPEFFYPTLRKRIIYSAAPGSRPMDTAKARVELAEIPFVRLRELSGREPSGEGYEGVVRNLQEQVSERGVMTLDFGSKELRAGGVRVRMAAAELAFAAMLMRRTMEGKKALEGPGEGPDPAIGAAYLAEYRKLEGKGRERTEATLAAGMDRSYFLQRRARYTAALRRALGDAAEAYSVKTTGTRPRSGYELVLSRDQIRLCGEERES